MTSRVPFVLREARSGGHCKNAILKDAEQLRAALKCLLEDATLTKVLRANSAPQGGPVPRKYLPNWAEKWTKDVGPEIYPIAITVVGELASCDFVILAAPDGVHGVFKHVSHEATELCVRELR